MTACCNLKPDNEVHVGGPDGCALWCFIPDEFLFEHDQEEASNDKTPDERTWKEEDGRRIRNSGLVAGSLMESCILREGNITESGVAKTWQAGMESSGGVSARLGLGGVMSMKIVVAGVLFWAYWLR